MPRGVDVPWLEVLRDVPADAAWPRLMTAPHPQAVGSYGDELAAYAQARTGRPLRWWQRLAVARLLEHDDAAGLCWDEASTHRRPPGRQVLAAARAGLWRLHQGDRFGEAQLVVHTGKDLTSASRSSARRGAGRSNAPTSSRCVTSTARRRSSSSRTGHGGWCGRVTASTATPRRWRSSTRHGRAPDRRRRRPGADDGRARLRPAAARLDGAPQSHRPDGTAVPSCSPTWPPPTACGSNGRRRPHAALDDVEAGGWRHRTGRRRAKMITDRLAAARAGVSDDADEPDPESAFVAQWLNRSAAPRRPGRPGEPLLTTGCGTDVPARSPPPGRDGWR